MAFQGSPNACSASILSTSGWAGDTILLVDAGRRFRRLLSADMWMYNFWDLSFVSVSKRD